MSFGSNRNDVKKLDKKRSPPRYSAEVVHQFDSNLRAFDPSRKRSPKSFLKRGSSEQTSTTDSSRRPSMSEDMKKNPFAGAANNFQFNAVGGTGHNNRTGSTGKTRRAVSPSSNLSRHKPLDTFDSLFGRFSSSAKSSEPSHYGRTNASLSPFSGAFPDTTAPPSPFYKPGEVSDLWIAAHARLNETVHAEDIIRTRIQDLELEQLRLIWNFKNELAEGLAVVAPSSTQQH